MRIAGGRLGVSCDQMQSRPDYLATENWPTIHDAVPTPTDVPVYYDEHMKQYVPQGPGAEMPVETAFNPKLMLLNTLKRDVMDNPAGQGSTLQDAYLRGVPGVPRPSTPDTVVPTRDTQYEDIMGSGFV